MSARVVVLRGRTSDRTRRRRARRRRRSASALGAAAAPSMVGDAGAAARRGAATTTCATSRGASPRPAAGRRRRSTPASCPVLLAVGLLDLRWRRCRRSRAREPDARVLWLDAHGDFNTPDDDGAGFLGGMCLAARLRALGRAASARALDPARVVLCDVRDLDAGRARGARPRRRRASCAPAARRRRRARRARLRPPRPRRARPGGDAGAVPGAAAAWRVDGLRALLAEVAGGGASWSASRSPRSRRRDAAEATLVEPDRRRVEPVLPAMSRMRSLVEDLHERRARARLGGGEERIARQHAAGKLTARERIALLIDEGTFTELGIHAQPHFSQRAMDGRDAPADGVITGYGRVDGRMVARLRLRLHGHGRLDGHDRRAQGRAPARARADEARSRSSGCSTPPARASRRRSARCSPARATCSARRS